MTTDSHGTVSSTVARRGDGDVHTLTVCREAKLNVLSSALMTRLVDALNAADRAHNARVIVLRGAGEKAFIGGADIVEMAALTPATARTFITGLHGVCAAIRGLSCPVVAAIDGYCLGGGLEVAAACDLRISTSRARFSMPEVKVGIPSVIDAVLLPGLIGTGRARDLVMTGRTLDADEALRIGLVGSVTSPGEAFDAAVDASLEALIEAGPLALASQKALCNGWDEPGYSASVAISIEKFAQAFESGEPQARMQAFLERRRSSL